MNYAGSYNYFSGEEDKEESRQMLFQAVHVVVPSCSSNLRFDRNMVDPVTGRRLLSTYWDVIVSVSPYETLTASKLEVWWVHIYCSGCNQQFLTVAFLYFQLVSQFSPLSVDINQAFVSATHWIFSNCAKKPCRQHQNAHLPSLESLQSPFFPVLMHRMSFNQSFSLHLPAQMHQVAGWSNSTWH